MRETGGLWAAAPDVGGREQEEALRLLEESQALLRTILLGIGLQYRSLDLERCRVMGEEQPGPDPASIQIAASLVTLCALFGFQRQAEGLAAGAAQAGSPTDMMDVKLGAVSILVTLLRLVRLAAATGGNSSLDILAEPPEG